MSRVCSEVWGGLCEKLLHGDDVFAIDGFSDAGGGLRRSFTS